MLKNITEFQIKALAEMLSEGEKSRKEITQILKMRLQTLNAIVTESLFAKEQNAIKAAMLKRLLDNAILAAALASVNKPRVTQSRKTELSGRNCMEKTQCS